MIGLHPMHDLDAADVRQVEIKDDDIDIALVESGLGGQTSGTFFNVAPVLPKELGISGTQTRFVVYDQDAFYLVAVEWISGKVDVFQDAHVYS